MPVGLVSKNCTGLMLNIVLDRIYRLACVCVFFCIIEVVHFVISVNYFGISYDWGCFPLLVSIYLNFFFLCFCYVNPLVIC